MTVLKRYPHKGFTLIELLIVIVIIGILTTLAIPVINDIKAKIICSEAITRTRMIIDAMNLYRIEKGAYPRLYEHFSSTTLPGFSSDCLSGTFFATQCYYVMSEGDGVPKQWASRDPASTSLFAIEVIFDTDSVATNDAPRAADARAMVDYPGDPNWGRLVITAEGRVYHMGVSKSGYPDLYS
ncbi:MAG: prepilin-type N-terminal cleavage/methylation domain-containing protein [Candidatus Omnitrophica bacterium]|nr:prepilin-type N-terminal cleavage/methylation domain-containing protein [Candidatus Omnitrophota bacterium]